MRVKVKGTGKGGCPSRLGRSAGVVRGLGKGGNQMGSGSSSSSSSSSTFSAKLSSRIHLAALIAFLGTGQVVDSRAEAVPTVEEMLERSITNRKKNDKERLERTESRFAETQEFINPRFGKEIVDLPDDLSLFATEPEEETLMPDTVEDQKVEETPASEEDNVSPTAENAEDQKVEEQPVLEEISVPPATDIAEDQKVEEQPALEEEELVISIAQAVEEPKAEESAGGDEATISQTPPAPPTSMFVEGANAASVTADQSFGQEGFDEFEVSTAVFVAAAGAIVVGAISFLRTLLQFGNETKLRERAKERHQKFMEENERAQEEVVLEAVPQAVDNDAVGIDSSVDDQNEDILVGEAAEELETSPALMNMETATEEVETPVAPTKVEATTEEEGVESLPVPSESAMQAEDWIARWRAKVNVTQAEDWIARWRAKENVTQAEDWIARWRAKEIASPAISPQAPRLFRGDFVLKSKQFSPKEWPRPSKPGLQELFALTQKSILKEISVLEKKALQLQCQASLEKTSRKVLQDVSSFEKKALELQYTTSAAEIQRKLLQEISALETRALELQFTSSAAEIQRKLLQEISALEKKALKLQLATSATETQRKILQDASALELKALEQQFMKSAAETQRKTLQDPSAAEKKSLGQQYMKSAAKAQRNNLGAVSSAEKKALENQYAVIKCGDQEIVSDKIEGVSEESGAPPRRKLLKFSMNAARMLARSRSKNDKVQRMIQFFQQMWHVIIRFYTIILNFFNKPKPSLKA